MRRTVVYVACPMRKGIWSDNVRTAAEVGRDLMRKGYSIVWPMGSWLLDIGVNGPEAPTLENWMTNDFAVIEVCDAVFRVPGESEGGDLETDFAARHDVPVFWDLNELYQKLPTQQSQVGQ